MDAPEPINVAVAPEHKDAVLAMALIVGIGLTVKFIAAVAVPHEFLPNTVYVALVRGAGEIVLAIAPVPHVYEVAPFAVKFIIEPAHATFPAVIVTLGKAVLETTANVVGGDTPQE